MYPVELERTITILKLNTVVEFDCVCTGTWVATKFTRSSCALVLLGSGSYSTKFSTGHIEPVPELSTFQIVQFAVMNCPPIPYSQDTHSERAR